MDTLSKSYKFIPSYYKSSPTMELNSENIIFVLGNSRDCFGFCIRNHVSEYGYNLTEMLDMLRDFNFVRINRFTIINTKYIEYKISKRCIALKGGSIHKVSRNFWKQFDNTPTNLANSDGFR